MPTSLHAPSAYSIYLFPCPGTDINLFLPHIVMLSISTRHGIKLMQSFGCFAGTLLEKDTSGQRLNWGINYFPFFIFWRYSAGLINQLYSHISAIALGVMLGADIVLPPAAVRGLLRPLLQRLQGSERGQVECSALGHSPRCEVSDWPFGASGASISLRWVCMTLKPYIRKERGLGIWSWLEISKACKCRVVLVAGTL